MLYIFPLIPGRILRETLPCCHRTFRSVHPRFCAGGRVSSARRLFLRFPVLEEILRLVPGLYSLWLRAWGSRIGKLTYWAPQTSYSIAGCLDIGDHVVFGAGVRIDRTSWNAIRIRCCASHR